MLQIASRSRNALWKMLAPRRTAHIKSVRRIKTFSKAQNLKIPSFDCHINPLDAMF